MLEGNAWSEWYKAQAESSQKNLLYCHCPLTMHNSKVKQLSMAQTLLLSIGRCGPSRKFFWRSSRILDELNKLCLTFDHYFFLSHYFAPLLQVSSQTKPAYSFFQSLMLLPTLFVCLHDYISHSSSFVDLLNQCFSISFVKVSLLQAVNNPINRL